MTDEEKARQAVECKRRKRMGNSPEGEEMTDELRKDFAKWWDEHSWLPGYRNPVDYVTAWYAYLAGVNRYNTTGGKSNNEEKASSVEWQREHLAHVQRFLVEMYQTMVDPVEEFHGNVEQLCTLLLERARQDRETLYQIVGREGTAGHGCEGPYRLLR